MNRKIWRPQPGKQTVAILTGQCIDELLFGGARGGGKTDFLLGDFGQDVGTGLGRAWRGILFRKNYPEFEEVIERSEELYPTWFPGARRKGVPPTWYFPDGERLLLRRLDREGDAEGYQGHSYPWIGWDELGNWATLAGYRKMLGTFRSAHDIPQKRIRASANPGGVGHNVVKQYFAIDRYPQGMEPIVDGKTGMTRMFVKSRLEDNQILMQADPLYFDRLEGTGSPELVRAWKEGDWDVVLGAFFDCWRSDKHVIEPFQIPEWWTRFTSFDWGSARPFSHGWWAVSDGSILDDGRQYPKGALIRYREWYGMKKDEPNVGLKMDNPAIAQGILKREGPEETKLIRYRVADPAIFAHHGGPSIAEQMANEKVYFRPGDNTRVAGMGAISGISQIRDRLIGMDGRPMVYCFKTCTDSIRTIPIIQHDENRMEDTDSDMEDHALDDWRYGHMSRPWSRPKPPQARPIDATPTLNDMIKFTEQVRAQD